ncbi:MAG: MarR family transcriptional regulator [Acidimicrobiia bacterium]|nr:MarR family transcriptional regulator [Acidimicrobiia bacterium]
MSEDKPDIRQHAVKTDPRPRRTTEGDAFTMLVVGVASLGGTISEVGEVLAGHAGQTLARWVFLDAIATEADTVAEISRRLGQARQSVQRIANVVVGDGLAVFEDNPAHQRAKLVRLTPAGRRVLRKISVRQKKWAETAGELLGGADIAATAALVRRLAEVVEDTPV